MDEIRRERAIDMCVSVALAAKLERRCATHNWYWPATSYTGIYQKAVRAGLIVQTRKTKSYVFYTLTEAGKALVLSLDPEKDANWLYPNADDIRTAQSILGSDDE